MALRIPSSDEVGQRIRKVRELAGFTQRELAKRMGSNDSALLSQLENGQKKIVDLAKLMKVADACAGVGELVAMSADDILDFLLMRTEWDTEPRPRPRPVEGVNRPDDDEGLDNPGYSNLRVIPAAA